MGLHADITEFLTERQLEDLAELIEEPEMKDTVSEEVFKRTTAKWRMK